MTVAAAAKIRSDLPDRSTGRSAILIGCLIGYLAAPAYAILLYHTHSLELLFEQLGFNALFLLPAIGIAAGLAYLVMCMALLGEEIKTRVFWTAILAGCLCRAILFFTDPVAEADFFRYLWDGASVANGLSPYGFSPDDVLSGTAGPDHHALITSEDARNWLTQVTYPDLPTIYPIITQLFFGLSQAMTPWSLAGWKLVLLAVDGATLWLLFRTLQQQDLPTSLVLIYWLNPILLRYGHASLHMDGLVMLGLAAMLYCFSRYRLWQATASLSLAIGVKLWPILLVPLLLQYQKFSIRQRLLACSLAGSISVAFVAIMVLGGSSLQVFASEWQRNDAVFGTLVLFLDHFISDSSTAALDSNRLARLFSGLMIMVLLCFQLRKPWHTESQIASIATIVTAALFLLAPTGYPWYFLWLLPFLTIRPQIALLALSVTLPLYELRFWYENLPDANWWKQLVVWIEFGPILIWLLVTSIKRPEPDEAAR
ncbi:glycosyltransferase 87 family protein [Coralliovum pocilloporae]|uniref:glycosyltransferase 87 family protein n=1 Tax=Coralliovum pocilloporae TaxID=3066369 RepID=UPI00330780B1